MDDPTLAPAGAPPKKTRWRDLRWSTRLMFLGLQAVLLVLLLEGVSRAYWFIWKRVPVFHSDRIFYTYFPEWQTAKIAEAPRQADGNFNVLVLGASTWSPYFGPLGERLEKELEKKLHVPVRVFNCSYPGRTSRDALLAYRHLENRHFDLVVVGHSVNDQYMNNIAPDGYQHNYSHGSRYYELGLLNKHHEHGWFLAPMTLRVVAGQIGCGTGLKARPTKDYRASADVLHTPPDFEANLEKIVQLARRRGARVLLPTFAWYVPANYTEEAFAAKTLDYDIHCSPVSTWGEPDQVTVCIKAHNERIRALARRHPDVLSVDMDALMPHGKKYWNDCCHFNEAGCTEFARLLVEHLDARRLAPEAAR